MTTLAQLILDTRWQPNAEDTIGQTAINLVRARLRNLVIKTPPIEGVVQIPDDSFRLSAEKFVFHDFLPAMITAAFGPGGPEIFTTLAETTRLPADVCWIEYSHFVVDNRNEDRKARIGWLIDSTVMKDYDDVVIFVYAWTEGFDAIPSFGYRVPRRLLTGGYDDKVTYDIIWSVGHLYNGISTKIVCREAEKAMCDLVYALFFINTPRVCEVREATPGPRLQRARARRGKPPLLEYKHLSLRVGHGAPRYAAAKDRAPGESVVEYHRRLHRVVGHLRIYRKGREKPHVSWVPAYWRGDATLGVVLHEREVKQ